MSVKLKWVLTVSDKIRIFVRLSGTKIYPACRLLQEIHQPESFNGRRLWIYNCRNILVLSTRPHSNKDVHHRDSLWWHMQAGGIVKFVTVWESMRRTWWSSCSHFVYCFNIREMPLRVKSARTISAHNFASKYIRTIFRISAIAMSKSVLPKNHSDGVLNVRYLYWM